MRHQRWTVLGETRSNFASSGEVSNCVTLRTVCRRK